MGATATVLATTVSIRTAASASADLRSRRSASRSPRPANALGFPPGAFCFAASSDAFASTYRARLSVSRTVSRRRCPRIPTAPHANAATPSAASVANVRASKHGRGSRRRGVMPEGEWRHRFATTSRLRRTLAAPRCSARARWWRRLGIEDDACAQALPAGDSRQSETSSRHASATIAHPAARIPHPSGARGPAVAYAG